MYIVPLYSFKNRNVFVKKKKKGGKKGTRLDTPVLRNAEKQKDLLRGRKAELK